MRKELFYCVIVGAVSLTVAAVCHRFFPGCGPILKPLLWPLAVLPFFVRPTFAASTAVLLPLLSAVVNGMPGWAAAAGLCVFSGAVSFALSAVVGYMAIKAEPEKCGGLSSS